MILVFILDMCSFVVLLTAFMYGPASSNAQTCGCPKPALTSSDSVDRATNAGDTKIEDAAKYRKSRAANHSRSLRQAANKIDSRFWVGGVIHYIIDTGFSAAYRAQILEALDMIESSVGKTHLEFVEARIINGKVCQDHYVNILKHDDKSCWADNGMQPFGPNKVSLNEDLCRKGTIVHEMLHALGRKHEHSRPDRDKFVNIVYENIRPGLCDQFAIMEQTLLDSDPTLKAAYDIESIMHYGPSFFACPVNSGKFTMLRKDNSPLPTENRDRLTELDKEKIRLTFPSSAKKTRSNVDLCGDINVVNKTPSVSPTQSSNHAPGTGTNKSRNENDSSAAKHRLGAGILVFSLWLAYFLKNM